MSSVMYFFWCPQSGLKPSDKHRETYSSLFLFNCIYLVLSYNSCKHVCLICLKTCPLHNHGRHHVRSLFAVLKWKANTIFNVFSNTNDRPVARLIATWLIRSFALAHFFWAQKTGPNFCVLPRAFAKWAHFWARQADPEIIMIAAHFFIFWGARIVPFFDRDTPISKIGLWIRKVNSCIISRAHSFSVFAIALINLACRNQKKAQFWPPKK